MIINLRSRLDVLNGGQGVFPPLNAPGMGHVIDPNGQWSIVSAKNEQGDNLPLPFTAYYSATYTQNFLPTEIEWLPWTLPSPILFYEGCASDPYEITFRYRVPSTATCGVGEWADECDFTITKAPQQEEQEQ